jgi:hypothetical protein
MAASAQERIPEVSDQYFLLDCRSTDLDSFIFILFSGDPYG